MHEHDPEKKVVDFDRLCQMRREQGRARKRTIRRVIAGAAAALLLVGTFLFLQLREAFSSSGFWQNFSASAPAAHTEGPERSA